MLNEWLIKLVDFLVDKNLLTAGQVVVFLVFIVWWWLTRSDHKQTLGHIQDAHQQTLEAKNQQIKEQTEHIKACDERYAMLRQDVNELQSFMNSQYQTAISKLLGGPHGQ